jgi:anti-sigma factor RsiW
VAAPFASGWLLPLVVAFGALAVTVTLNLRRPADFAPFADELVASHVRAQVSGRDIDVISTDRHTVKPWFNGRLDYSPPVEDLAASGFALEGGRLDYLAHRRVAVLVYRYRKHVIDVYVFPQTGGTDGGAPATLTREGYSLAHWDAEGMTWWAITDAAPDALSGLETALKARLAAGSARTESG